MFCCLTSLQHLRLLFDPFQILSTEMPFHRTTDATKLIRTDHIALHSRSSSLSFLQKRILQNLTYFRMASRRQGNLLSSIKNINKNNKCWFMPECSEWPTLTTTTVFVSGIAVIEPLASFRTACNHCKWLPENAKNSYSKAVKVFFCYFKVNETWISLVLKKKSQ